MSKEDALRKLGRWFEKISPPVPVGGLQITDFAVRYAGQKGGRFIVESMRLQPGVIEDGKVKSKEILVAVLAELRKRVAPNPRKPISVVLSLSMRDVYIQTFSTPQIGEGDFEEAAGLNARMISPINADNAYYGWQRVSQGFTASANADMLGAFVQRPVVDEFVEIIESAGFGIAAIEFDSMSLARSIERAKLIDSEKPFIIVHIATEGISMVVVRKGLPHFHYFHPWSEIQGDGKSIAVDRLKATLEDELERVINFYFTHWSGEKISDVIFITPVFGDDITELMKEQFSDATVQIIDPAKISVVVGAAWRGRTPRSSDTEISLASLSALGVFERQQLINFVRIWRNILATALGFLLLLFVSTNIFLRNEMSELVRSGGSVLSDPSIKEYLSLSAEAEEFNKLVSAIAAIKGGGVEVAPLLLKMRSLAGDDVSITRLGFDPSDSSMLVNGTAPNESTAVEFKNRIASQPQFTGVNLPLNNILSSGDRVSFSLNFKVASFDFVE
ncbi:MAG: hypothetical protein A3C03_00550 [Candidatus Colwellbacteria bacterium RIFCSPHIGHO2_02_FULL_45_17]|uniref:Uncharacterized protein n=2 Tax=Candidatus Colwelliibacteriota TaxID=1817904 RepID=A0A1G1ZEM0_9BACT|nr:MAG: hypothetical protein A3C03_00550 [Candidatus Colwellbacteria bacterium RIFCSPHIGHO2_02_FULL_45_17]OGY60514.1 MAG: hypothetical protein A3I33_02725 [Candidatus Colwellbacteria bacterium RIFCSPLOWO2_02_FULL_45_11]OGY62400.1 MAG: hypothetical protein A3G58_01105 [Candidatus Colwellbacteria bacterium RIFCSPLOWO2_12_FULL_46_17]